MQFGLCEFRYKKEHWLVAEENGDFIMEKQL